MMLKGMTAQYLVRRTYKVKPGDTILFHAAAGGVGLIAEPMGEAARRDGDRHGRLDRRRRSSPAKNGCDHVDPLSRRGFRGAGEGDHRRSRCQVVYDGVGKDTFPASLDCLQPLGMFVSFGSASGPIDAFNIGAAGPEGLALRDAPDAVHLHRADGQTSRRWRRDLFGVVTSGAVKIPVHHRVKLSDAADAHRALEGRQTTGATVMTP